MKTYHNEAKTGGITKNALKKNLDSFALIRFRKITILRLNFRNESFQNQIYQKNVLTKVGVLN